MFYKLIAACRAVARRSEGWTAWLITKMNIDKENDHGNMTMSFFKHRAFENGGGLMEERIAKSKFKPRALHYFRQVERSGKALIITDHGKPVLKISPYSEDPVDALKALRGTVIEYKDPLEPVGEADWESLK